MNAVFDTNIYEEIERVKAEKKQAEQDFDNAEEIYIDAAIHKLNAVYSKYDSLMFELREQKEKTCPRAS